MTPEPPESDAVSALVRAAQAGDLAAYSQLVARLQTMVYAVCRQVLQERSDALDAAQDAFLRAFWGLSALSEPAAFAGYLRRTAIRCAYDMRRKRRTTFAPLEAADAIPVLDDNEQSWSQAQRLQLGRAVLTLTPEERRITERFYYGSWSVERLAVEAQVSEPTMRKRLQRIRDKLRQEIEMSEQRQTSHEPLPPDLTDRVVDLLARPLLVDLPENPVAKVVALLREQFSDYQLLDTPEVIDLTVARSKLQCDPVYVPENKLFHLDRGRILRYDLSLPLWLETAGRGAPLRLLSTGKVYRNEVESTTHLSAFHQLELLHLDDTTSVNAWSFIGRTLAALDAILPGSVQRVCPSEYPFCSRAWDIGLEWRGEYHEVLGCGIYLEDVVRLLGGDPARHTALGLGIGLERLASLHYRVPDIRLIDSMRV
jgi:RNA polymerase sigma factor (sigma-70 family)